MVLPPWHLHPEVWALAAVLEGSYLWAVRRVGPAQLPAGIAPASRKQVTFYTMGVAAIWVAATWPMHELSEHYLFSVHMVQHMLISMVAAPLMLLGTPDWLLRMLLGRRPVYSVARRLTRPFVAFVIFNTVIVGTHWPAFVDFALHSEVFHFGAHALLFGAALLMWWPVISPLPEMPSLSYPGRMLYLFLQSILPTVPASFLTFGSTPLYHFYETVPRIWGISALTDQRIAGLTMKILGGLILWSVIAVIFFKWYGQEQTEGWDALEWRRVERELRPDLRTPTQAPSR
jgi:putative membrane protein